jgi:hypothetical protein
LRYLGRFARAGGRLQDDTILLAKDPREIRPQGNDGKIGGVQFDPA